MADHTQSVRYGDLDHDFVQSLYDVSPADDGPFFMLNLMRYREWADYRSDAPAEPISGRAADDIYAPLEILDELGAEVVFFGEVAQQLVGDEGWERVAVVRYPTVASFLAMQERPDFVARHVHKDAGMERTIIALCRPAPGDGSVGSGQQVLVELSESELTGGPGRLFSVAGTPVGDGRTWRSLRIAADDVTPTGSTAVSVVPVLNLL